MKANKIDDIYATGVVIKNEDGKVLFVKRKEEEDEYRGFWSIPSISIDRDTFHNIINLKRLPDTVAGKFTEKRFPRVRIKSGKLLISGVRQRTKYRLYMAVCEATADNLTLEHSSKYEKFKFYTPTQFLKVNGRFCETCTSLYLQSLVNQGILPLNVEYLEIPPEIADSGRKLQDYTQKELWQLAWPNYLLLLKGKTGGDGHFIRSITLDRFLSSFVKREISRGQKVLDIGCGSGTFLLKVKNRTKFAYGLEIAEDAVKEMRKALLRVRTGNLYDAPKIFRDIHFDWVVLNLVLQWMPNLNKVVTAIRSLLVKNGKVLVTMPPPEFSKNGKWLKKKDIFNWLITKPSRRKEELVMINRLVGPVWFYPRSTVDILNSFGKNGLYCINAEHIYLDSYLTRKERLKILKSYPALVRHEMLPAFTALTFIKLH